MSRFVLDDSAWGSPWRHKSVRDKGILVGGLMVAALISPWQGGLAVFAVSLYLMVGLAKVPRAWLILSLPLSFIVLGTITVGVTFSWESGIGVTPESLAAARDVFCRASGAGTAMLLLAATTPMIDLLTAMRKCRIPDPLIDIAALVYRMIFLSMDAVGRVTEAQAGRLGFRTRKTALRSSAMTFSSVFVRTFDRAQRMEDGFAGRGYVDSLLTLDVPRVRSGRFVAGGLTTAVVCTAIGFSWRML